MTPEERRRRRLDRLIADLNRQSAAMREAMDAAIPDSDELDELDDTDT